MFGTISVILSQKKLRPPTLHFGLFLGPFTDPIHPNYPWFGADLLLFTILTLLLRTKMAERCANGLDYEYYAKQNNYTAYLLPTMDAQIDLKAKSQAQRPNKDNVDL